jgi:hypothetical protein
MLDAVLASGATSVAIVGTGKNVGKTVTMRALYEAAIERGLRVGLVSAGRDGEALDVIEHHRKPRLWLYPGTWIVTTPEMLSHAGEDVELERIATACGPLRRARVSKAAFYELIGPPTASGVRTAIQALQERCELVLVDGAIDRLATISTGEDAVIVACGAAAAASEEAALEDVRALVARLRIPRFDEREPLLRVEGALFPDVAERLIASEEVRQVVVHSPAFVMLTGKSLSRAASRLRLRCEHPVRVVAATIASIGPHRRFEPRAFLDAVGETTGLPTYDVYAGAAAGRETIRTLGEGPESDEFIVMRGELAGDLPSGVRVLREEPTYLLCERSETWTR